MIFEYIFVVLCNLVSLLDHLCNVYLSNIVCCGGIRRSYLNWITSEVATDIGTVCREDRRSLLNN